MEFLQTILAGAVQGLTEFLPVSSSGHLILFHEYFGFDVVDSLSFDVVLHLGTLVALVVFFWNDIWQIASAWIRGLIRKDQRMALEYRLGWYIIAGTIPAVVAGLYLEQTIETVIRTTSVVAWMLIVVGVLLYVADRLSQASRDISQLRWGGVVLIGCAQALALIPGVSRSGITIIAGLSQKLQRAAAARFSFLLSIPVVFGAGLKKVFDLVQAGDVQQSQWMLLFLGFVSSAMVGYLCIKYFLKFLQRHSLRIFAYYRIIIGIILLLLL